MPRRKPNIPVVTDFTMRDLFQSLKARKRPEDAAEMIVLVLSELPSAVLNSLCHVAKAKAYSYMSMSDDFFRGSATVEPQMKVAAHLFEMTAADPNDYEAVVNFLRDAECTIRKTYGKNDFKADRLNKGQRREAGLGGLSRRQYNKRFRLAARMEDKVLRAQIAASKRSLTLASKSRLASQLTWEQFSADNLTAAFLTYYVARANVRSLFTVGSQVRAYDQVCETMMKQMKQSSTTNWFAVAHVMPDAEIIEHLTDHERGELLGRYYGMLVSAGKFLAELWETNDLRTNNMIVKRGNDSSTWNLMAGAWNKLRDGWFSLCHALNADEILEEQCFGKVMRLIAADVARWHMAVGDGDKHDDTSVWADLPVPWEVLFGKETCSRAEVERTCRRYNIDPLKSGWIAREGKKKVEKFTPTPDLVHGVVVACPLMAKTMRKAGIFSGKTLRWQNVDVDLDYLISETEQACTSHVVKQTNEKLASV